jgi:hypothetical protein
VGGMPFASTSFVVTATADVASRISDGSSGYFIDHIHTSIEISGVGSYTILTPTRTFVNNNNNLVGFSHAGIHGLDLLDGPALPEFSTWDMTTPILPLTGTGQLFNWTNPVIDSTGGVISISTAATAWGFEARFDTGTMTSSCFGDGSGAACPCSNTGAAGEGCSNSSGSGALMVGAGVASLSADTVQMHLSGLPGNTPGVLVRGTSSMSLPAGDGLLCVTGNLQYSQVQFSSSGSTVFSNYHGAPLGSTATLGTPVRFQYLYRDAANLCGGPRINYSNVVSVNYIP